MKTTAIRALFLEYFQTYDHTVVPSSSLIPYNDPTLLFTNAGMVQFKETFLGQEARPYVRATSSQRCVRAGGKHNDLENVGFTARHHTFFEMLGNFSFGDYFKKEAIEFAWTFLTKHLKLPEERLWVTVYKDDEEAADLWLHHVGVSPDRFSRCGEDDNFWSMGDVGPCGPCTEIFYDHGPGIPGGPPGSPEADADRYIEIWNLVFMQFNRDASGVLTPLPKPSVDTGMGLERIAAVMQGVHTNYDIDLFQNLIGAIGDVLAICEDEETKNSLQVIADHIRSTAFLISDGVLPGNEGRGYVLRRIIRRAVRHGHRLGARDAFFHRLVEALVVEMGDAYPELVRQQKHIEQVLLKEEVQFAKTLEQGLKLLEQVVTDLSGDLIPGDMVFRLYDTYGFPVDLTADIARERGLRVDEAGFDRAMALQQQKSRAANQFSSQGMFSQGLNVEVSSVFVGYEDLEVNATVIALFDEAGQPVDCLVSGNGVVVLDHTPFYAESGGQAGDAGILEYNGGSFAVQDTQKEKQAVLHLGQLIGASLSVGDVVHAVVSGRQRASTALNHSATHLLHAALRQLLGDHVQQKGSLVDSDRLRFDFLHFAPLTQAQIFALEHLVNQQIRNNHSVVTDLMTPDAAKESGAMALFGEKYGSEVRVLSMGDFSKELCGGTHVLRTGDIGCFKILSETGVASGVRRMEAVTGAQAIQFVEDQQQRLTEVSSMLKTDVGSAADKLKQLQHRAKTLEKEVARMQAKLASSQGDDLVNQSVEVKGVRVLAATLPGANAAVLRSTLDQLKNKLKSAVVVLAAVENEKIQLVAGVTKNLTDQLRAGDVLGHVAKQVDGRGGGRAEMAQGGGNDVKALPDALASVKVWVDGKL
jgi:alanyl-tRNA synthetase